MRYSLRRLLDRITPTRNQRRRPVRGTRPTWRPLLDPLEDRMLLAHCLWNAGSGPWTDPANWQDCDDRIPQAGDDVTIGVAGVTVTHTGANTTVSRLTLDGPNSRLHFSGNALTVTTALAVGNSSTLRINAGTLTAQTPATFEVTDATLDYQGGTIISTPVLTSATLILGPGAMNGADFIGQGACRLIGNLGAGQTIWVRGGGAGDAVLTVSAGASNAGTILLESVRDSWASNVAVAGTGSFTNAEGGVIRANRGAEGQREFTGSLLNRGLIDVEPVLNNHFGMTGGVYEVEGGGIRGPGYVLDRVQITTPPQPGLETVLLGGAQARLLGNNPPGWTLYAQGNSRYGDANLTVAANATNEGTILLESIHDSWAANLSVPLGGRLTNWGTIEAGLGRGGARTITAQLVNHGILSFWAAQTILTTTAGAQDHQGYLEVGTGARLLLEYLTITESGTVVIYPTADVEVTGQYVQNGVNTAMYLVGGTLHGRDAPIDVFGGLISAFGVIDGILRNGGLLEVAGAGTIGYLNITGDYIQFASGAVNFDIASAGFATIDYDYMNIGGQAQLNGLVRATLLGGFRPERGDYFVLFYAGGGIEDAARVEVINLPKGLGLYPYQSDGYYVLFAW